MCSWLSAPFIVSTLLSTKGGIRLQSFVALVSAAALWPQGLVGTATDALECVERACQQIMCSEQLYCVLRVVLTVGNTLNFGTHRGAADGVRLESLKKLADMKVPAPPQGIPSHRAPPLPNCRGRPLYDTQQIVSSASLRACSVVAAMYESVGYTEQRE